MSRTNAPNEARFITQHDDAWYITGVKKKFKTFDKAMQYANEQKIIVTRVR